MAMARAILVILSVLFSVAIVTPTIAGITPEQKCASAKMKAVGKNQAAKAKCFAKALSQSAAVVADCLTLAERKFADAFAKAEAAGGCLHTSDATTIESKIDVTLYDIVGDLGCGNGTTEGDEQCDDGNLADGDTCSSTCTTPPCRGDGQACSGNLNCCSGFCEPSSLTCTAPPCRGDGQGCGSSWDCCSTYCDPEDGICTTEPCIGTGQGCSDNDQCCSNACGPSGTCLAP